MTLLCSGSGPRAEGVPLKRQLRPDEVAVGSSAPDSYRFSLTK